MTRDYEALADAAERGELAPDMSTLRQGEEAAAEARRLLLDASGAADAEELMRITQGRPAAGTASGPSPVVRARVPQALKDRLDALAQREHRQQSDIVREALASYIQFQNA